MRESHHPSVVQNVKRLNTSQLVEECANTFDIVGIPRLRKGRKKFGD